MGVVRPKILDRKKNKLSIKNNRNQNNNNYNYNNNNRNNNNNNNNNKNNKNSKLQINFKYLKSGSTLTNIDDVETPIRLVKFLSGDSDGERNSDEWKN
jgi:hypothetical protein